jgi:hypothetical protein
MLYHLQGYKSEAKTPRLGRLRLEKLFSAKVRVRVRVRVRLGFRLLRRKDGKGGKARQG